VYITDSVLVDLDVRSSCAIGNNELMVTRNFSRHVRNHSVESGVPPKRRFGGQGATPRPYFE